MKTKSILLSLLLVLTATLILAGSCTCDDKSNLGATGAKEYQPTLSEMSDQAIRDRIDELYKGGMSKDLKPWGLTANYSAMISVYQNELILRQLEGKIVITAPAGKEGAKKSLHERFRKLKKFKKLEQFKKLRPRGIR